MSGFDYYHVPGVDRFLMDDSCSPESEYGFDTVELTEEERGEVEAVKEAYRARGYELSTNAVLTLSQFAIIRMRDEDAYRRLAGLFPLWFVDLFDDLYLKMILFETNDNL